MTNHHPAKYLGCIADDYTGASDLASFLAEGGLRTLQINGLNRLPQDRELKDIDAVVIALKTRTTTSADAIDQSTRALHWLRTIGCAQFYFKYCSTFDSSKRGNIGPVTNALLEQLGETSTLVCPALPVNGRTVYQGYLFVFDQLLHESPMKDHPLTPMRDSHIGRLLNAQTDGATCSINVTTIEKGEQALANALDEARKDHRFLIMDGTKDDHLETIGRCARAFSLVTGGSGLAGGIAKALSDGDKCHKVAKAPAPRDPTLIISGSCSTQTRAQLAHHLQDAPGFHIQLAAWQERDKALATVEKFLVQHKHEAPIIYCSDTPEQVTKNQTQFGGDVGSQLESIMADVAIRAKALGYRNFIVAGGETSGAVTKALEVHQFFLGRTITPGVPLLVSSHTPALSFALKSGNFGSVDFFSKALETMQCT